MKKPHKQKLDMYKKEYISYKQKNKNLLQQLINQTTYNYIWRSLQIFLKQGVTFFIFILCAKLLTPYDFGIYNYILAIIFLLIIFGDFGISTAASKYIAEYNAVDKEKLKIVLFNSSIIILTLATIISILLLFFSIWFMKDKYYFIIYLIPLILIVPMTSLYDGIYVGLKKFKQLTIISLSVGIIAMIFMYYLINNYGLVGALISQNLYYLLLLTLLAVGYRDFYAKINSSIIKEISKYAILIGLSNIGYFLYTRVDIVVLGYFGYIKEIGYYEIINKIFILSLFPIIILGTVIAPDTTKNFALKKYPFIIKKLFKECFILFIFGIILALSIYLFFPFIFRLFFSKYYTNSIIAMLNLMLLLVPFRFYSTYITIGYINPSGKLKQTTMYMLLFGFINFILDVIFINIFGFIGVIYSSLLAQFLYIPIKDISFFLLLKDLIRKSNTKIKQYNMRT